MKSTPSFFCKVLLVAIYHKNYCLNLYNLCILVQFQPNKLHGEDDMISNYFDDSNDFFNIDDAEVNNHFCVFLGIPPLV